MSDQEHQYGVGPHHERFPVDARIYLVMTVFYAVTAAVYGVLAEEWGGFVLLLLASAFAGFLFVYSMARATGHTFDMDPDAPQDEAHQPYFPESSIWPLGVAGGLTLTLAGLVLGLVVMLIGVVLLVRSCIGWAVQSKVRS